MKLVLFFVFITFIVKMLCFFKFLHLKNIKFCVLISINLKINPYYHLMCFLTEKQVKLVLFFVFYHFYSENLVFFMVLH